MKTEKKLTEEEKITLTKVFTKRGFKVTFNEDDEMILKKDGEEKKQSLETIRTFLPSSKNN